MRKTPVVVLLLGLAIVLALPFLLRNKTPEPDAPKVSGPARKLVIVSPHAETIETEFEQAFSAWTQARHGFETKIEWLDYGGTTSAVKFVEDEFERKPDGVGIDIFFGGGADPFMHFARLGLLHRCSLPAEILDPIPQTHAGIRIYDDEQQWFGACMSGFGILYNKRLLAADGLPEPTTWAELGEAGLFGNISSADPRQSGSIHMAYEIILQAYGWEEGWGHVLRIGANCRAFTRAASEVPREVSIGEAACGMAIDYYALRAIAEAGEENLGFVLPDNLTVVNPDGIGVLRGAPNVELAEMFVGFVLSEAGQKLWMLEAGVPGGPREHKLYRLPVIPGLIQRNAEHAVVSLDPFQFKGAIDFDLEKKEQRWGALNELLGKRIIDVHGELKDAWAVLKDLPPDDPRVRELLASPISEAALLELAQTGWNDADTRARLSAEWSASAIDLYTRLAEGE